jgi:hypothetical protein
MLSVLREGSGVTQIQREQAPDHAGIAATFRRLMIFLDET